MAEFLSEILLSSEPVVLPPLALQKNKDSRCNNYAYESKM